LREIDGQVKIIVSSGDLGSLAVEELLGFGASYLLAKAFPTEELSRAVDSILQ
jgi:DNA-binding NarL/FixJ family response regulator